MSGELSLPEQSPLRSFPPVWKDRPEPLNLIWFIQEPFLWVALRNSGGALVSGLHQGFPRFCFVRKAG